MAAKKAKAKSKKAPVGAKQKTKPPEKNAGAAAASNQSAGVEVPSEASVRNKLQSDAERVTKEVREIGGFWKRKWAALGKACLENRDKNLFKYLRPPFLDLATWAYDNGIGRSTMYAVIRCYSSLKDIPMKELTRMTKENAEHLAKLPADLRKQPQWIKDAQEKKESDFGDMVAKIIKKNKKESDTGNPEKKVPFIVSVYETQKTFINECLEEWIKNNNLDNDKGRALELICAEVRSGFDQEKTLIFKQMGGLFGGFFRALKDIRGVLTSEKSVDEQLADISVIQNRVVEEFNQFSTTYGEQMSLLGLSGEQEQPKPKGGKKGKSKDKDKDKEAAAASAS